MKRLWVADDIYKALKKKPESVAVTLRGLLGLRQRTYTQTRRSRKSSAVTEGIARAKKRGVVIGRPKYPEYLRETVRKLRRKKFTLTDIMLMTGMSKSTVKRCLRER